MPKAARSSMPVSAWPASPGCCDCCWTCCTEGLGSAAKAAAPGLLRSSKAGSCISSGSANSASGRPARQGRSGQDKASTMLDWVADGGQGGRTTMDTRSWMYPPHQQMRELADQEQALPCACLARAAARQRLRQRLPLPAAAVPPARRSNAARLLLRLHACQPAEEPTGSWGGTAATGQHSPAAACNEEGGKGRLAAA